jgi:sodium/potassium/calcium exchanger 6
MRLSRPQVRARRNTIGPVRPSLVGALEFQAVLNSLQKSRNIQTIPLDTRRYSDNPDLDLLGLDDGSHSAELAGRQALPILTIDTSAAPDEEASSLTAPKSAPVRSRAVSAGVVSSRDPSPSLQQAQNRPGHGDWHYTDHARVVGLKLPHLDIPSPGRHSAPQTPSVEISAPTPTFPILEVPEEADNVAASDRLRVADAEATFRKQSDYFPTRSRSNTNLSARSGHSAFSGYSTESDSRSPRAVPQARHLPRIVIPRERRSHDSTPSTSPFPTYWEPSSTVSTRPPSIHLPPPLASPESLPISQTVERESPSRPTRWWPYHILPAPGVLISTLFPTIYHWHDKSIWEKMIGIVAAPSVFFLTVTLPVVESEKETEDDNILVQPTSYDSRRSQSVSGLFDDSISVPKGSMTSKGSHSHTNSVSMDTTGRETMATLATTTEQHYRHNFGTVSQEEIPSITLESQGLLSATPDHLSEVSVASPNGTASHEPGHWNRWLVLTQLYLAPLFCMFSFYIQSPSDLPPSWLILPTLICLLTSTMVLIPFLLTTTATYRPIIGGWVCRLHRLDLNHRLSGRRRPQSPRSHLQHESRYYGSYYLRRGKFPWRPRRRHHCCKARIPCHGTVRLLWRAYAEHPARHWSLGHLHSGYWRTSPPAQTPGLAAEVQGISDRSRQDLDRHRDHAAGHSGWAFDFCSVEQVGSQ